MTVSERRHAWMWGTVWVWAACAPAGPVAPVFEPRQEAAARMLAARHAPSCDSLPTDTSAADLEVLAERWVAPGTVAVRAARCRLQRPGAEEPARRWLRDPDTLGLAYVVVSHVNALSVADRQAWVGDPSSLAGELRARLTVQAGLAPTMEAR